MKSAATLEISLWCYICKHVVCRPQCGFSEVDCDRKTSMRWGRELWKSPINIVLCPLPIPQTPFIFKGFRNRHVTQSAQSCG